MAKQYLLIALLLHGALASFEAGNGGNTVHDAENLVVSSFFIVIEFSYFRNIICLEC